MQLAHDRDLKDRERELSLRKETYLAAAEAVHAGLIALSRFANLDIPHDKLIDSYTDKAPSIAKVHIIAKEETVRAVITFSATLDATFIRLFAKRGPLVKEKLEIDVLRAQVDTSLKENSRTLELLKQSTLEGTIDQRRLDLLNHNLEFERTRSDAASQEADTLTRTLYHKQLQLMEDAMEEKNKLVGLLIPVILSIRKELELPIEDEVGYRRVMEAATSEQLEIFKEYLQQQRAAWG